MVSDVARPLSASRFGGRSALRSIGRAAAWLGSLGAFGGATAAFLSGCTTVDPGPNFVVPDEQFDADFFFCRIEPQIIFAKRCGPGDSGDAPNSCHFSSSVSGMPLANHGPVDCDGNGRPVNRAQIGAGSAAQGNLQAASVAMSRDYQTAPFYVRPTGQNHPRAIFDKNDPVVDLIRQWAQK